MEMKEFEKKYVDVLKPQVGSQNKLESSSKKQGGVLV